MEWAAPAGKIVHMLRDRMGAEDRMTGKIAPTIKCVGDRIREEWDWRINRWDGETEMIGRHW